ncbi:MAG: CDP-diacylglycerol--serine O-phosphatidyltransferase [Zetaproteobacteria bacterium]|nr:CDP-diacylglycerol--serine O-phosphatidyltransferase [Zetaproteobacteria bacterium]
MVESSPNKRLGIRRGIYVLPSLFTTMGLFAGFYSIIAAIQGLFIMASWAIVAAAIFDALDGRVARLLNASTDFGAEYDSLCDIVSFGLAPAILVYLWVLAPFHQYGWLAAFMFVACAALRLARFNVQIDTQDKRYFQGLPTPGAALLLATMVLFFEKMQLEPISWLSMTMVLMLAWLMVSRVRFFSGKDIDLRQRRPFPLLFGMLIGLALLVAETYKVLFFVMFVYCAHGPFLSVWQYRQLMRDRSLRRKSNVNDDAHGA